MVPNLVMPNLTYLCTRRTEGGQMRFKPHINEETGVDEVANIIGYCLALAQQKYDMDIHGLVAMSNHLHYQLTDTKANLPAFFHHVHRNIANCINDLQNTKGPVWSRHKPGKSILVKTNDIMRNLTYIMCNPVEAGLVPEQSEYISLVTKPEDFEDGGTEYEFTRPNYFFSSKGKMPEKIKLKITIPPGTHEGEPEKFVNNLKDRVTQRQVAIKERRGNRPFLGNEAILKLDPFSVPKNGVEDGGFNPMIICLDTVMRIAYACFLKNWRKAYREALRAYRAGDKQVVFPYGTYKMALEHNVKVEEAGCQVAEEMGILLPSFM
jgi:putative transposase